MTVRNKALGRARAAFATSTQYIRGDVVNYQGALYAAKESFTSGGSFSAGDWDLVLGAPSIPATQSSLALGAAKNSIGSGLPAFVGRQPGDIHYDPVAKKEYILTGTPGAQALDTFTRADAALNGSTTEFGALTWISTGLRILSNTVRASAGSANHHALVNLGTGGKEVQVSFTAGTGAAFRNLSVKIGCNNAYSGGWLLQDDGTNLALFTPGGSNVYQSAPNATADGQTSVYVLAINAAGTTCALYKNGVLLTTQTGTAATGTHAGFMVRDDDTGFTTYADSFTAVATGTLAWERTEPDTHTHSGRIGDAAVFTIAAGLPGFAGRKKGDGHYNLDDGRFHLLTGDPGVEATDTFTAADGVVIQGRTTETGALTYTGSFNDPIIRNGRANAANGNEINFSLSPGTGPQVVAYDVVSDGSNGQILKVALNIGSGTSYEIRHYSGTDYRVYRNGTLVETIAGNINTSVGGLDYRVEATFDGVATVALYINGVLQFTYTYASPIALGAGVRVSYYSYNDPAYGIDNLYVMSGGTLRWNRTDPLYFQGVVGGAITVANHVLKPGIRIPSACAVRRFVVRFDAALSGGATTVVARRYNNGADTGDSLTVTVADGQTVGSVLSNGIATAQGDMWKFDVTAAGGSPQHMLLALDAWGS